MFLTNRATSADSDPGDLSIMYSTTPWSERALISLASLLFFVRFLYFFRALESTGKLVAVLFEIAKRMRIYVFIIFVAMFTFGYAIFVLQAGFPLYARMSTTVDDDGDDVVGNPKQQGNGINDFGSLKRSIVMSFGFSFDFDYTIFSNSTPNLTRWGILLGCLTSLFVSIILFNLLIAFISNVYSEMAKRGTSQWRFMQGTCQLSRLQLYMMLSKCRLGIKTTYILTSEYLLLSFPPIRPHSFSYNYHFAQRKPCANLGIKF